MQKKFFFSHDLFRELDDVDKIKKMFQRNETMVIHPMKFNTKFLEVIYKEMCSG